MPSMGSEVQRMPTPRRSDGVTGRAIRALHEAGRAGESVVVLGFEHLGDDAWAVLGAAGVSTLPASDVPAALDALTAHSAQVAVADAQHARALVDALHRDARRSAVNERRGSGVQGLRDRIGVVGGTLQISSPPNRGTVLLARLPIEEAEPLAPCVEGRLETKP